MRTLSVNISHILDIIVCSKDYGFDHNVLLGTLAEMMDHELSDLEIKSFASWFLTDESKKKGYSEEDYDIIVERLTAFRDKYITPNTKDGKEN